MNFYKRNLPHWQPPEAEYFITFRLAGSLPKEAITKIKAIEKQLRKKSNQEVDCLTTKINRKIFEKYEELLENGRYGPLWLKKPDVAKLVCEAIEYRDETQYDLYSYCVMPNHVHLVFKLLRNKEETDYPVTKILQSLKRFTAKKANKILNRTGQFWQHESFDRVIRDAEELESTIRYVLNNPVKAGLVENWQNWSFSYCKSEFKSEFT